MSEPEHPLSQLVSKVQGLEAARGSESPPASRDMEGKEGKKQQSTEKVRHNWLSFSPASPEKNQTRCGFNP